MFQTFDVVIDLDKCAKWMEGNTVAIMQMFILHLNLTLPKFVKFKLKQCVINQRQEETLDSELKLYIFSFLFRVTLVFSLSLSPSALAGAQQARGEAVEV